MDLIKQAFYENGSMVTVIEDIKAPLNMPLSKKCNRWSAYMQWFTLSCWRDKKEINLLST